MAAVPVKDGELKRLEEKRCHVCGRLLFRISLEALKPGKLIETKCKCDAMSYVTGATT